MTRNILVQNGTLVLRNSTIYMNLTYDGEFYIEVCNGGNLTIINSTITAYNIHNNYYIEVDSGAVFYMNNSEISYAGYMWGDYGNKTGIWINTNGVVIANSFIHNNYCGLCLYLSSNNTITNNTIINNSAHGMYLSRSNNSTISDNTIFYNSYDMFLYSSSNNTISGNTIPYSSSCVYLYSSNDNIITNNIISNNTDDGVYLSLSSSNNTIMNNTISNNSGDGMYLGQSSNNTISSNPISYNFYGVYLRTQATIIQSEITDLSATAYLFRIHTIMMFSTTL